MSLSYTLPRCQMLGSQTESLDTIKLEEVVDGYLTLANAATITSGGNPQNQQFEFLVIHNDQVSPTLRGDFMVVKGQYSLNNGEEFLEDCEVLYSSNSGGLVNFQNGEANLRIIGITSHEHFNIIKDRENDIRVLAEQRVPSGSFSPFIETQSNVFVEANANPFILTPTHSQSRLIVDWHAEISSRQTALGQSFRSNVQMHYMNFSSVLIPRGESVLYGGLTFPNDENMGILGTISSTLELTVNNRNSNGDWEIMPMIRIVDANTTTAITSLRFHYRELLG